MSVAIMISPGGLDMEEIQGVGEDGEPVTVARVLRFMDESGITIAVGPFNSEQWESFGEWINDPAAAAQKQQARAKILQATGSMPRMDVPKGKQPVSR